MPGQGNRLVRVKLGLLNLCFLLGVEVKITVDTLIAVLVLPLI